MWKCPRCGREFGKKNQTHSCVSYPIENHFKGKKEIGKPLFESLVKAIETHVGPVKIESLPCCIHLVSSYTFSGVWILKDKIRLDFRLDHPIKDPRISKELQMSANRFLYYVELTSAKDIDKSLLGWIKEAYHLTSLA